jgi:outer membrane protein TolC
VLLNSGIEKHSEAKAIIEGSFKRRTGWKPVSRLGVFAAIIIACSFVSGCFQDAGIGGTGELVIPHEQLRQIDSLDLHNSIAATRPSTQPAGPPPSEMSLAIEECRRMALMNNLDLQVQLFTPAIAHTSLTAAEAQFEAVFFASLNGASSRTPTGPNTVAPRTDEVGGDVGLTIPLQTGGSIRLDVPTDAVHTHVPRPAVGTSWANNPNVTFIQPLLRGGGLYVNTQGIRIAFYEYQRTQAITKLEVIRVLTDVDRAYWQLFAAREALKVRKKDFESTSAQLDRARRQANAGKAAEPDVIRAESGLADTFETIIIAENNVRLSQRNLKRILNEPALPLDARTTLIPTTPPAAFPYDLEASRLTDAALSQRMEMLDLELQLAEQASSVAVARNGMLPLVTLQYTYGVTGLGNTNSRAWEMAWERTPDAHHLGLHLEVPIGNEAARGQYRGALLRRSQLLASRQQESLQIRQEIADALDTLQTDWQRIVAAHERVVLSTRTRDIEVRQFNLGLRTSTDVLIAESDLAAAQLAEVSAISDYQIAQVDIAFATGTVLGASHVDWQPVAEPHIPRY